MDNRTGNKTSEIKEIIDRALARINTCIPGIIDSFDGETQTATVIPAVSMKTFIENKEGVLEFPPIVNAPLVFPFASTAGFALTLPIRRGDPCIILFSQRSIDNWHDKGGIQPSEAGVAARHHDLTDALIFMAASPIPGVLSEWEGEGIQLRNRSGTNKVTVYDDRVVIDSTSIVIIDAPQTTIKGHLTVDGNTTLGADVMNRNVNISSTHVHAQDPDSKGGVQQNTKVPQ